MKHFVKSMVGTVSGFIRSLFFDRQQRIFTSTQSPEELLQTLRQAQVGALDNVSGLNGSLRGNQVRLTWSPGFMRRSSFQMFYGQVEPAPEGSRMRGHFAPHVFVRCFMAVWLGGVALFAIVTVWTLIFPVACFLMVWLAALLFGTSARHAEADLTVELQRLCGEGR